MASVNLLRSVLASQNLRPGAGRGQPAGGRWGRWSLVAGSFFVSLGLRCNGLKSHFVAFLLLYVSGSGSTATFQFPKKPAKSRVKP